YVPYTVTIDPGGEVTWSNNDSAAHTVTSGTAKDGPDENFDSSLFMAGTTFSVKFDGYEYGTYPYFCMVHPWMTGEVIVEAAVMVTITDLATDDGIQVDLEFNQVHVNYKITATQNGNVVLQETGHAHTDMMGHHMIPVAASDDNPVDIQVVSLGIGLPGEEANWSGPIDEIVATKQVVPEFGTIAMMILGISIVSIIAVTAKTRVIPRL
ncbi:MAG: PEFG-CTERM sorting domain-containing protein, partial [Nitrosopumilaceae archaeon]